MQLLVSVLTVNIVSALIIIYFYENTDIAATLQGIALLHIIQLNCMIFQVYSIFYMNRESDTSIFNKASEAHATTCAALIPLVFVFVLRGGWFALAVCVMLVICFAQNIGSVQELHTRADCIVVPVSGAVTALLGLLGGIGLPALSFVQFPFFALWLVFLFSFLHVPQDKPQWVIRRVPTLLIPRVCSAVAGSCLAIQYDLYILSLLGVLLSIDMETKQTESLQDSKVTKCWKKMHMSRAMQSSSPRYDLVTDPPPFLVHELSDAAKVDKLDCVVYTEQSFEWHDSNSGTRVPAVPIPGSQYVFVPCESGD